MDTETIGREITLLLVAHLATASRLTEPQAKGSASADLAAMVTAHATLTPRWAAALDALRATPHQPHAQVAAAKTVTEMSDTNPVFGRAMAMAAGEVIASHHVVDRSVNNAVHGTMTGIQAGTIKAGGNGVIAAGDVDQSRRTKINTTGLALLLAGLLAGGAAGYSICAAVGDDHAAGGSGTPVSSSAGATVPVAVDWDESVLLPRSPLGVVVTLLDVLKNKRDPLEVCAMMSEAVRTRLSGSADVGGCRQSSRTREFMDRAIRENRFAVENAPNALYFDSGMPRDEQENLLGEGEGEVRVRSCDMYVDGPGAVTHDLNLGDFTVTRLTAGTWRITEYSEEGEKC